MRAGNLDREIAIDAWAAGEPNEYGTVTEGWTPFATVRAQLVQASTDEFLTGHGEADKRVVIFRIRWLEGVTTTHRVNHGSQNLNIREIKEIGRRKGMELRCEVIA
jgi:head-tail adaptor